MTWTMPGSGPIRRAIAAVATQYRSDVRAWLTEKNPVAIRQIDAQEARIDAAELAGDRPAVRRACTAWQNTWLFWIQNYKMENRRTL